MQSRYVRRVDQLDAVTLDSELFILLNAQYRKAFSYFPSSFIAKTGPELDILFRFLFRYLPLEYLGSTFGQNMFELTYCNSKTLSPTTKNKLRLLAVLSIGVPWFWDRVVQRILINVCRNDKSHSMVEASYGLEMKFINLWKILSLLNFCVFLQRSNFPSIIERILQIRPLYTATQDIKLLQYDGISKELLWHGMDEFIGFTLPLINIYRVKNYFRRIWSLWSCNDRFSNYRKRNADCLICGGIPNFPHTIGCAHLFCYYCISSMLLADPTFSCVDCNFATNGLDSIKPLPINKPKTISDSN